MAREINLGKVVGPAGPQGPAGATGEAGPAGPKGADGKSAYAIAVDGGYSGTEADFTNLLNQITPIRYLEQTGINIPVTLWAANSTYDRLGFYYRATVPCTGITTTDIPTVNFKPTEAGSGNYATFCESIADGVYIWAKEKPTSAITVDIICIGRV